MRGVEHRVKELCDNFEFYLRRFDKLNPFTGPSVYFHLRTLERLNSLGVSKALEDELFFEYLYATLTSWGMHRMGPKGAKLVEFMDFVETLQRQKSKILNLRRIKLTQVPEEKLNWIMNKLWEILSNLRISSSKTQLIAGSKALHHLLPDLLPPIDRQHTLRFIYGYNPTHGSEERWFKRTYSYLWRIGFRRREVISQWVGKGFHTSETKVIDNAIVSYVKTRMKRDRQANGLYRKRYS